MAFVSRLVPDDRSIKSLHPTTIECRYMVAERDGRKVLQLNSYGSDDRQIPEKLSQTLQFGEETAHELLRVLKREFGDVPPQAGNH